MVEAGVFRCFFRLIDGRCAFSLVDGRCACAAGFYLVDSLLLEPSPGLSALFSFLWLWRLSRQRRTFRPCDDIHLVNRSPSLGGPPALFSAIVGVGSPFLKSAKIATSQGCSL